MAIHDTPPENDATARQNDAGRSAGIPRPRPATDSPAEAEAGPAAEPSTRDHPADRRLLLALKSVIALLVTGSVTCVCLAVHQLAHQSPFTNTYVGLAGVSATGVAACVPAYLHFRRKDPSDGGH
ncbi:hypothetical protein ACIBVL_16165 [Streptomyces sp. NPDC049687]|uniref:hypothetical protein n=1 Tax=Streptomyces sp. NPDC049687 TaxID=3365596 RepID=UPI0037AC99EF